jgi:hypothetical protein
VAVLCTTIVNKLSQGNYCYSAMGLLINVLYLPPQFPSCSNTTPTPSNTLQHYSKQFQATLTPVQHHSKPLQHQHHSNTLQHVPSCSDTTPTPSNTSYTIPSHSSTAPTPFQATPTPSNPLQHHSTTLQHLPGCSNTTPTPSNTIPSHSSTTPTPFHASPTHCNTFHTNIIQLGMCWSGVGVAWSGLE